MSDPLRSLVNGFRAHSEFRGLICQFTARRYFLGLGFDQREASQIQAVSEFCEERPIQCVEAAAGIPLFVVDQKEVATEGMDVIQ